MEDSSGSIFSLLRLLLLVSPETRFNISSFLVEPSTFWHSEFVILDPAAPTLDKASWSVVESATAELGRVLLEGVSFAATFDKEAVSIVWFC